MLNKKALRSLERHSKTFGKYGIQITAILEAEEFYYNISIKEINFTAKISDIEKIFEDKNKNNKAFLLYALLKYLSSKYNETEVTIDDVYLTELLGIGSNSLIYSINVLTKLNLISWKVSGPVCTYKILDNIELIDYTEYAVNEFYYIYKFLDNEGRVIYVGRTQGIDQRMKQHFGPNGHLPAKCYQMVEAIEYAMLDTEIEMAMAEMYYINKYKPIYNIADMFRGEIYLEAFENLEWKKYEK